MIDNGKLKFAVVTTSWDDGDPLDMKLAELLDKYEVPATFYLPIQNTQRTSLDTSSIQQLAGRFDIGGHTFHHLDLTKLSSGQVADEVNSGKTELEAIIGQKISAFCYPMGKSNSRIAKIVGKSGFTGARTLQACRRKILNPLQMGTLIHARNYISPHYVKHALQSSDAPLFRMMLQKNLFSQNWDSIAREMLYFILHQGGIWHLCGHSWEGEANNDWTALESLFREIKIISDGVTKWDNSAILHRL